MFMRRLSPLAFLIPLLYCLAIYWHGLFCWFQQDDFAWLGLVDEWHTFPQLLNILFKPMAQGTIRPISERAYFMLLREWFDLNAFPYHALVFATQFGNLLLLNLVVKRISGSAAAGFLTAMLWCSNSVLFWPLCWASAYNQILCAFVFLACLWLFIRYTESGASKFYLCQWALFLAGFGVLEENVVYPVLAMSYAALFARPYLRRAALMFPVSVLYAVVHLYFAKAEHQGIYAIEVSTKTMPAFLRYWMLSLWPRTLESFISLPQWVPLAAVLLLTAALMACLPRNKVAIFGSAWFLITLGPYLLVPNHVSDYYLAVPTIGLALIGACALIQASRRGWIVRSIAVLLMLVHAGPAVYTSWNSCLQSRITSTQAKQLVFGVRRLSPKYKGKHIFLNGIEDTLFRVAVYDRPFRLLGLHHVYLTPDNADSLLPFQDLKDFGGYTLPAISVLRTLENDTGIVLQVDGDGFTDITPSYRFRLRRTAKEQGPPRRIDPGEALFDSYLLTGWYQPEIRHRWMQQKASFVIGPALAPDETLHVVGFCAATQQKDAPFSLTVSIGGRPLSPVSISLCGAGFDLSFPLSNAGPEGYAITLALDKVSKFDFDNRPLGLAIQRIEVR